MSRLWIALCGLAVFACGTQSPPPPVLDAPAGVQTVTGSERLGWDQAAADAVDLAALRYAIYVDGARTEATGVTCGSSPATAGFPCTARLPAMTAGPHTLELASFVVDGGILESARSAPMRLVVAAQTASAAKAPILRDGLIPHIFVDGVMSPTDIAFAPDGRLFIAERDGRICVVRDGRLLTEPAITLTDEIGPAGQLLAIALDPQFDRTHFAFAIYTARDRTGAPAFTLARFREVSDTLGDRAVLLESASAASTSAAALLRFGPDGKLYAAYDDGGDPRRAHDPSSLNGKVLRLNADGTTPGDARGTPIYAGGYRSPAALDWDPTTATLWVADRAAGAAPFAFYRGALFPEWAGRMVDASTVFAGAPAADVNRVAVGPDGAIYYLTSRAIVRVVPDRGP